MINETILNHAGYITHRLKTLPRMLVSSDHFCTLSILYRSTLPFLCVFLATDNGMESAKQIWP